MTTLLTQRLQAAIDEAYTILKRAHTRNYGDTESVVQRRLNAGNAAQNILFWFATSEAERRKEIEEKAAQVSPDATGTPTTKI